MKIYDSILVARYLLSLAMEKKRTLNVTKVQKMLYIVYGHYLAKENHQILSETPKAWPYGPVFPRAQQKVDYNNITPISSDDFNEIREDQKLTETINRVIDEYSNFSATQLSNWSHEEGGPWYKTVQMKNFNWNYEIPNYFIESYFKEFTI